MSSTLNMPLFNFCVSLIPASFSSYHSHSTLLAAWLLQSLAETKLNPFPVRPLTRVERAILIN